MAAVLQGEKRGADGQLGDASKKLKEEARLDRKRKVALLIAYNGKGYYGLQVNPGFPTIEGEVIKALLEVGVIPQEHHDHPQKMSFQRAARTDKGVSAAGNLLSLKMLLNVDDLLDKINEKLPPAVRVFECVRTTNGFNSKNHCDGRTYIYLLPTYAFAPVEEVCTLDYRISQDIIEKVNEVLEKFVGTHNFHNFTSGVKPTEAQAHRYIKYFECRLPFVRDGVEFCVLSVRGQSFMMHQIRKMVGLTIAMVKGYADMSSIDMAWEHEKVDIPKAPGLGLMLDKLHYEQYNKRWASDGSHEKIDFQHLREKLDKFKEEYIFSEIIKEEIETQSMMQWLATLPLHSCTTERVWNRNRKHLQQGELDKIVHTEPEDGVDTEDASNVEVTQDSDKISSDTAQCVSESATESDVPCISLEAKLTNQNVSCDQGTKSDIDCDSEKSFGIDNFDGKLENQTDDEKKKEVQL